MNSIGIIGIGAMGKGIAKNVLKAGYPLSVYARNTKSSRIASSELQVLGAKIVDSVSTLFGTVETLILCVPDSQTVEELLIGEGGLSSYPNTSVVIVLDFSTSHPESTKKIAAILKEKGIGLLDTPMTGSVREADEGKIKLIVGGNWKLFEANEALLKSVSEVVYYAGRQGSGNLVKLANNYLSILDQTVAATIAIILEQNEIPREVYNKFLTSSSANSGGLKLMFNRINTGDFDLKFGLGLATKDIGYCKDLFKLPITDSLYILLKDACDSGYRNRDIGTIFLYLKESLENSIMTSK